MFYFLELINRLKYLGFAYLLLLIVCYNYFSVFFSFLDFLFKTTLNSNSVEALNYYIYTHPFELYYSHLFFCFIISFYIIIPYIIWQFIDFIKPGIYINEYSYIKNKFLTGLIIFIVSYYLLYTFIIPLFFEILETAKLTYFSSFYNVFFELKIQDFISFILYLNTLFTIVIFFLIILSLFIFKFSLANILSSKKLIYLIAIFFSTFISPPDVFSQCLLLLLVLINIELIIYLRIFKTYFIKKAF